MNKHGRDPQTIASFDPTWIEDEQVVIADRSTLQQWAECPAAAKIVEAGEGQPAHLAAAAGSQAHEAIRNAIADYVDSGGVMTTRQVADQIMVGARAARADVQPLTVDSLRYAAWSIAGIICAVNPNAVLRFDGGPGAMSGQLAGDVQLGASTVRATGELDLLLATESAAVVDVWDWKTGRKRWTADMVARSFQPQMYAWLVFVNYREVEAVRFRVLNTFSNQDSHTVEFRRDKKFKQIDQRIRSACGDMLAGRLADQPELRPAVEKCRICPAVLSCPVASLHAKGVANDRTAAVDYLVALEAMVEAWRAGLTAIVDDRGEDIQGTTCVFGRQAPRQDRTPPARLYPLKK